MKVLRIYAPRKRVAPGERGFAPLALPQKYLRNIERRAPRRSILNRGDFNVHGHRRFRLYRGDKVNSVCYFSLKFVFANTLWGDS